MGIFRDALTAVGSVGGPKTVARALVPSISQRLITGASFLPPAATSATTLSLVSSSPWVHSILGRIADMSADAQWYVTDKKDKRDYDHPICKFIESGSDLMSGHESLRMAQQHMDAAGETFWLLGRDSEGKPASYLPLPAHWVQDVPIGGGGVYTVAATRGSSVLRVPASEMIWFRTADPKDPFDRGMSITKSLMTDISLEREMASFMFSFIKNRARPDFIVTGTEEAPLQPEEVMALEASWTAKFGGQGNGKPMFSSAPLKTEVLTGKMAEAEMVAQRKLSRDFISEVYGIPPEVFGRVENSNRATADAADYVMARYVVEPRLRSRKAVLQMWGQKEWPDLGRKKLAFDTPVKEDQAHTLNVMRAIPSAFTYNEVRRQAGLPPKPDGDDYVETGNSKGTAGTGDGDPGKLADGNADSTSDAPNKKKKMLSKAAEVDLAAEIEAALESSRDNDLSVLLPVMLGIMRSRAEAIGGSSDLSSELEAYVAEHGEELLNNINRTTADLAYGAVDDGGDRSAMIAAIIALFAGWVATRALLVGATEANGLLNATTHIFGRTSGGSKTWLTRADERVRRTHNALQGVTVPATAVFVSPSGDTAMHPGGFSSAAENVNCRCAVHAHSGTPPTAEDGAAILATHEALLSVAEAQLSRAVSQVFTNQQMAVLAALSKVRE